MWPVFSTVNKHNQEGKRTVLWVDCRFVSERQCSVPAQWEQISGTGPSGRIMAFAICTLSISHVGVF